MFSMKLHLITITIHCVVLTQAAPSLRDKSNFENTTWNLQNGVHDIDTDLFSSEVHGVKRQSDRNFRSSVSGDGNVAYVGSDRRPLLKYSPIRLYFQSSYHHGRRKPRLKETSKTRMKRSERKLLVKFLNGRMKKIHEEKRVKRDPDFGDENHHHQVNESSKDYKSQRPLPTETTNAKGLNPDSSGGMTNRKMKPANTRPNSIEDNGGGSEESSQNLVVYILPAILAFLVLSIVITLFMYRAQKRKANRAPPSREEPQLPLPGKFRGSEKYGRDSQEMDAVELVDFVEYRPRKERELMSGCHDDEADRRTREPLLPHMSPYRASPVTPPARKSYFSEWDADTQHISSALAEDHDTESVLRKSFNRQLHKRETPTSPTLTEEEMGPLEKIYISIPPRPPSENYIEATSTSTSVSSSKSITVPKLEWLTKNIAIDVKNEASYYQSDSSTQTASNVDPLSSKTVFGTPWQFGGTFTRSGGVLQHTNSDVSLTLGPNAVHDYVDIYGAVFTETEEIRKKFDIKSDEMLITPLVEYHASGNYQFRRHLKITLPHALPEDSDEEMLKVYGFSVDEDGRVSVQLLSNQKRGHENRNQDCFWEFRGSDQSIQIWTTHFSGYFCTACESKSRMSSVCARVFGSHVQIKSKRREIRIIMYIWDRRLNIRDFLQRIVEQECDMDRQLLADQQIPLPETATSDSHIIMKMDCLGDEEDLVCWRHVMRPNTGRPLFRPLQARKLFQIIHCCHQADPLRVEWAMENIAGMVPSPVFQCCIDVMHVSESTTNFEQALEDADEELMRTFYVRDLRLSNRHPKSPNGNQTVVSGTVSEVDVKHAIASLSQQEMESVCEAFGLARKDIGNLCKKFSTEDSVKHGLVEECCRRVGQSNFSKQLPQVLKQIGLSHALDVLEKRQQPLSDHSQSSQSNTLGQSEHSSRNFNSGLLDSSTDAKQYMSNPSGDNFKGLQKQVSGQSNEVFFEDNPSHHYGSHQVNVEVRYPQDMNGNDHHEFSRPFSQSHRYRKSRDPVSPPLSSQSFTQGDSRLSSRASQLQPQHRQKDFKTQKSSSSGSDSALRGNSINSSDMAMSTLGYVSVEAQADSKEFRDLDKTEELEEYEEETFKKEVVSSVQQETRQGFPDIDEETLSSRQGPVALSNHSQCNSQPVLFSNSSNNNNNNVLSNNHSYEVKDSNLNYQTDCPSSHSHDEEETHRKETIV